MNKPGKKRIEAIVEQISFASDWSEVDEELAKGTYLYKLIVRLKEAESSFQRAIDDEMEKHEVEYS